MPIRILDKDLNLLHETVNYISLQFNPRFYEVGEFEIHVNQYTEGADFFQKDNLIMLGKQTNKTGIIKHREIALDENGKESENWKITGFTLDGILKWRITYPPTGRGYDKITGSAETVMKHYIRRNFIEPEDPRRKINNLVIAPDQQRGEEISWSSRYKNIQEEISEIAKHTNLGFVVYADMETKNWVFDVAESKDLTKDNTEGNSPVLFSPDFFNIKSQSLVDSDINLKTVGIVGGQGVGRDRKIIEVGEGEGYERIEHFVDARDIEDEQIDQGEAQLIQRGQRKMSDYESSFFIEAKILAPEVQPGQRQVPFEYEKDFNLGDRVEIYNRKWDVNIKTPISEFREIYENDGFTLEAVFGKNVPDFTNKLQNRFEEVGGVEKQEIPYDATEDRIQTLEPYEIGAEERIFRGDSAPFAFFDTAISDYTFPTPTAGTDQYLVFGEEIDSSGIIAKPPTSDYNADLYGFYPDWYIRLDETATFPRQARFVLRFPSILGKSEDSGKKFNGREITVDSLAGLEDVALTMGIMNLDETNPKDTPFNYGVDPKKIIKNHFEVHGKRDFLISESDRIGLEWAFQVTMAAGNVTFNSEPQAENGTPPYYYMPMNTIESSEAAESMMQQFPYATHSYVIEMSQREYEAYKNKHLHWEASDNYKQDGSLWIDTSGDFPVLKSYEEGKVIDISAKASKATSLEEICAEGKIYRGDFNPFSPEEYLFPVPTETQDEFLVYGQEINDSGIIAQPPTSDYAADLYGFYFDWYIDTGWGDRKARFVIRWPAILNVNSDSGTRFNGREIVGNNWDVAVTIGYMYLNPDDPTDTPSNYGIDPEQLISNHFEVLGKRFYYDSSGDNIALQWAFNVTMSANGVTFSTNGPTSETARPYYYMPLTDISTSVDAAVLNERFPNANYSYINGLALDQFETYRNEHLKWKKEGAEDPCKPKVPKEGILWIDTSYHPPVLKYYQENQEFVELNIDPEDTGNGGFVKMTPSEAADIGAIDEAGAQTLINSSIDTHKAETDPHNQYLLRSEYQAPTNTSVTDSATNGNIVIDGTEVQVWDNSANETARNNHINDSNNPHGVTADQTGAIPSSEKGAANGVATLDANGLIPASQIPADDSGASTGSSTVSDSSTNGNIIVDGVEVNVWDNTENANRLTALESENSSGSTVADSATNGNIVVDASEVQVWDNTENSNRLNTLESTTSDHETRISTLESGGTTDSGSTVTDSETNGNIVVDGSEVNVWDNTGNDSRLTDHENRISTLETSGTATDGTTSSVKRIEFSNQSQWVIPVTELPNMTVYKYSSVSPYGTQAYGSSSYGRVLKGLKVAYPDIDISDDESSVSINWTEPTYGKVVYQ